MASGGPVQVYIKVLEARGIKGVEKNGNSDGMVELWVGKEKKNHLQTKHFDDSVTPQWHEEFLFYLPSSNEIVTLHLVDYNRIMKNVSLGKTVVEIARVTPGVGVDMWLPLDTQGEIRIFVTASPLVFSPPKAKSERLGSFRMILERTTYYPGEMIRGAMIYNVGMPRKIRGVRVRFNGETKTHWTESRRNGNNTYTVVFSAHYVFFDPIATLYGNPRGKKDDFKIQSGGYYWPFEFVLPMTLAPSFQHNLGRNSYYVKGYVDIPMSPDKTVIQDLNMTVQYGTLHPVLNMRFSKKAKALLASNQNISVGLRAPEVAYMGEGFPIDVDIENQGTKEVKEVIIELKVKYWFTAHHYGEGWKSRKVKHNILKQKVSGVAGFPVPPGARWTGQIQVQIPTGIAPSVPEATSPIVQVIYHFKATMNTTGNVFTKASNDKKLPVLIGQRYPFAPQIVAAPPPVPQISIAQAPQNVYQYLAPAPPMAANQNVGYVGPVLSHEQFVAATPYQPEQWVEQQEGAQAYDPNAIAQINPTLSEATGE